MTGCANEAEALELAASAGWAVDKESPTHICPERKKLPETPTLVAEAQLNKLTEFVAFLEKWSCERYTQILEPYPSLVLEIQLILFRVATRDQSDSKLIKTDVYE